MDFFHLVDFLAQTNLNLNMIDNKIKNFIKKHAEEQKENEVCGFIIEKDKKFDFLKCKNISKNPSFNFEISSVEYLNIKKQSEKIHYIYHSHPLFCEDCVFSEQDKNCAEALNLPLILFCTKTNEFKIFNPTNFKYNYTGRYYEYGKYDCFSLILDFFKNEKDTIIKYNKNRYNEKNIFFGDKLKRYFIEIFLENKFEILNKNETLSKNDVILFDIFKDLNSKHLGIYLGNQTFLHQPFSKLSRIENNWSVYKDKIDLIFRLNI